MFNLMEILKIIVFSDLNKYTKFFLFFDNTT